MEGKKVLWVVFSVTLALVVILAGGLFLLRPKPAPAAEAPAGAAPSLQGYDPYEYVRGTSEPPGLAPLPGQSEPTVIVVGEMPSGEAPAAGPPAGEVRPLVEKPAAAPQEALQPEARPAPQPPVQPAAQPPAVKPAAKPTPKAAPKAAPKPAPRTVRVNEYWIQAGSFSSASRADEVGRVLEAQGLAAKTSTRDLNGKTHFRVRVGPYASRAEAEKFLGWIRELKGFEESYISLVASQRTTP